MTSTTTLLDVQDLRAQYLSGSGTVEALRGVQFQINRGEKVAIVGESGSGKSTLSYALIGLLPQNARISGGRISFDGTEITRYSERQFRALRGARIGLIPQDPTVSLNPVRTIGHQMIEAIRAHHKIPSVLARQRAAELLEQAGIDLPGTRLRQYPHQLSGGMRQRVLIAIAVAAKPDLIIADEPTSALDATVQKRILDHLDQLTLQTGTALLLVTHDLGVAADRADRIIVMNNGEIVEHGASRSVLSSPGADYTRRLVAAAPGLSQAARSPLPVAQDAELILQTRKLRREFSLPARRGEPKQRILAVEDLSLEVARGETLALVGESGSGKSTTARLVLGMERADSGTITFAGEDVTGLRGEAWRQLRRRVQLIYQNPYASLDPRFSVAELITEPLDSFRIGSPAERRSTALDLLERVALPSSFSNRRPAELSGGQRQRVAIARALALSPELVVCDEPVSALDVSVQAQVLELLGQLQQQQGLSYLFITHDLTIVPGLAHRVAVMRSGKIIEEGRTSAIFENPQQEYTQDLLSSISGTRHGARS